MFVIIQNISFTHVTKDVIYSLFCAYNVAIIEILQVVYKEVPQGLVIANTHFSTQ